MTTKFSCLFTFLIRKVIALILQCNNLIVQFLSFFTDNDIIQFLLLVKVDILTVKNIFGDKFRVKNQDI
jgi:hypothetical protein